MGGVFDDEDVDGLFSGVEAEAEVLDGGEDAGGGGVGVLVGDAETADVADNRREVDVEVVAAGEAGLVDDRTVQQEALQDDGEGGHGFAARRQRGGDVGDGDGGVVAADVFGIGGFELCAAFADAENVDG